MLEKIDELLVMLKDPNGISVQLGSVTYQL
jgi:hypothetical protein